MTRVAILAAVFGVGGIALHALRHGQPILAGTLVLLFAVYAATFAADRIVERRRAQP